MVLLASTYDQSKYWRAEDLPREKMVRIKSVTEELVGVGADRAKKLVVWFTNTDKGLVLNRTNLRTIRGEYGDDTAGWVGKLLVVFPTQADFRGRLVPALRVRIPPPKSGNGPTAQPKSTEQVLETFGRPAPKPDDDMDDEIGF